MQHDVANFVFDAGRDGGGIDVQYVSREYSSCHAHGHRSVVKWTADTEALVIAFPSVQLNLRRLHTRDIFPRELTARRSNSNPSCITICCVIRLKAAFHKAHQAIDRIQVV